MFFQGQRFNKKRHFSSLSRQCKNKNCELFQKLRMKILRMNKKSEAVFEKCFSSLFYAQHFDDQILLRKKSCEVYKTFFSSNSRILTFHPSLSPWNSPTYTVVYPQLLFFFFVLVFFFFFSFHGLG